MGAAAAADAGDAQDAVSAAMPAPLDHVLLQAIARVNRPYEDSERRKTAGFVLGVGFMSVSMMSAAIRNSNPSNR